MTRTAAVTAAIATGMRALVLAAGLVAATIALMPQTAFGASRIKDIADFEGVRDNLLVGYGIVVGLNGTGDDLTNTPFTKESLVGMLERLGVNIRQQGGTIATVKPKNVAAVMVTADLPPYARLGQRLDVTLSSLGDSSSLAGGTLLVAPLKGLDGTVYAVAQGPVSVGGFQAGGEAASVSKNHPTVGRIPRGALVERELPLEFAQLTSLTVNLNNPDFTTAHRMAGRINQALPHLRAQALDPSTIKVDMPGPTADPVGTMARLETLDVSPDTAAKVVVDERTGTVVMGEQVRISTVAVASGALSISITETPEVSQALPLAPGGQTVVVPRTQVQASEQKRALAVLPSGASIGDVVKALNALGATPRDLIVILQAIKAAGALQAELEII
ncbi:MAG: flagellar basal body P-ring protein FlgI [Desulfarculus sp.]|nr:flagellar basal body P-ring protein FlgI [Desulfarculus sp.]